VITPEEPAAVTDRPRLYEKVRRAERAFRDIREASRALDKKGAEEREISGRAIAELHLAGEHWTEIARQTGLSRTTLLRRAQPYLEEKQP
jgi:DNA invertase Pin-like site-specific DNA recombinase